MYKPADFIKSFKIANIYPAANSDLYAHEDYVMLLSYLMDKYDAVAINSRDSYKIMDNSLYECSQNGLDLQYYVDIAENSAIDVNEIIVPDVLNDIEATIKSFEANKPIIEKYKDKYNFMFVSQATTLEEQKRGIDFINSQDLPNLSVGISKLSPLDRMDDALMDIIKTCKYPVHFLGVMLSFAELEKAKTFARGCDSQQCAYIAKNEDSIPEDLLHYTRKGRAADGRGIEGIDVDLAKDYIDPEKIIQVRDAAMKQLGIE